MGSTSTLVLPIEPTPWFRGHDGLLTRAKREDEKFAETWDIEDQLASGETISSVAWEYSGITGSSETNTTTTFGVTVTGTGTATAKITTSASRILEYKFRWAGIDEEPDDYGS